jgi:hypothetical protein
MISPSHSRFAGRLSSLVPFCNLALRAVRAVRELFLVIPLTFAEVFPFLQFPFECVIAREDVLRPPR